MSNFWNACYDAMMSSSLRRERDKADSRKMFQVLPPPSPGDVSLGTCSLSQGRAPHPRDVLLTLGMLPWRYPLDPRAFIPVMCSLTWGCHPRDMLLTPGMSPQGRAPDPKDVPTGTCSSPQGCAPHLGDVILRTCSSSQGHHPGDVLTPQTSPHGRVPHPRDVPKPQPSPSPPLSTRIWFWSRRQNVPRPKTPGTPTC